MTWRHSPSAQIVGRINLTKIPERARIGWILKADNDVKLNLTQDRSCAWTLLWEVKDSNLKFCKWTFLDKVKDVKWVGALDAASKIRLKKEEKRVIFYACRGDSYYFALPIEN